MKKAFILLVIVFVPSTLCDFSKSYFQKIINNLIIENTIRDMENAGMVLQDL